MNIPTHIELCQNIIASNSMTHIQNMLDAYCTPANMQELQLESARALSLMLDSRDLDFIWATGHALLASYHECEAIRIRNFMQQRGKLSAL